MGSEYPSTMAFFHAIFVNSCTFLLLKANQLLGKKRLAMGVKKKEIILGGRSREKSRAMYFILPENPETSKSGCFKTLKRALCVTGT